ncbi:MAG: ABC transporter ATP-binding protein, partial [Anaerolineae bacterium]|nr:ABC transporter ATP-binding protein [Anaerolineae bacterium]
MNKLKRLLKFVNPYRKEATWALMLLIVVILVDLSLPRLIQRLIDQGVTAGNMHVILTTSLLMIGLATLNALMMIGNTILAARVSQNFAADLRSALFQQVQTFSFGNLDQLRTGELMVRLTSDVNTIQMMILLALRIMTRAPLLMLGSSVLLVVTSPRLALIVAVFLPV